MQYSASINFHQATGNVPIYKGTEVALRKRALPLKCISCPLVDRHVFSGLMGFDTCILLCIFVSLLALFLPNKKSYGNARG